MSTSLNGVQVPIVSNVRIIVRDSETWIEKKRYQMRNRVTKLTLLGIARLFTGEFNSSTSEVPSNYYPKYIALGTGSTAPSVSDSSLKQEITSNGNKNRQLIAQRNIENIRNSTNVKVVMQSYIPSGILTTVEYGPDGEVISDNPIREAGLFVDETGNTCLARVVFDGISKGDNDVLDITWEFNIISYSETIYPTSIKLSLSDGTTVNDGGTVSVTMGTPTRVYVKALPDNTTVELDRSLDVASSDTTKATVETLVQNGEWYINIIPVAVGTCTVSVYLVSVYSTFTVNISNT